MRKMIQTGDVQRHSGAVYLHKGEYPEARKSADVILNMDMLYFEVIAKQSAHLNWVYNASAKLNNTSGLSPKP